MTGRVIDEVITLLSLNVSPNAASSANKFTSVLQKVEAVAGNVVKGVMAVGTAFTALVFTSTHTGAEISKLSEILVEGSDELQRWGYAALAAGGKAQDGYSLIQQLETRMKSLNPGEFMEIAYRFDLNPDQMQKGSELALAISKRFETLNKQERLNLAGKFGLDDNGLRLIARGKNWIDQTLKSTPKGFILSDKEIKTARQFNTQWEIINTTFRRTIDSIGIRLSPIILKVLNDLNKWATQSSGLFGPKLNTAIKGIVKGFNEFWSELKQTAKWLYDHIPAGFKKSIAGMSTLEKYTKAVKIVLWAFIGSLVVLNAKFLIISGAITGLISLFSDYSRSAEDATASTSGWTSIFKDFEKNYPALVDMFRKLKETMKDAFAWVTGDEGAGFFKTMLHTLDRLIYYWGKFAKLMGRPFETPEEEIKNGTTRFGEQVQLEKVINNGASSQPMIFNFYSPEGTKTGTIKIDPRTAQSTNFTFPQTVTP